MYSEGVSSSKDGIETIIFLLQFIFSKLPGLHVKLLSNDMENDIIPYFCNMISDRLRAEPYLFYAYISLLTSIAKTSQQSADSIYTFIDKSPSEFVSWPILIGSLSEAEKLIHTDNAQRGLLDIDLIGFVGILDLITAVMENATSCPNIRGNMQANTVELFIKLLHEPIHVMLKSKILSVLVCYAKEPIYAKMILQQLEYGAIISNNPATGIRFEFLNIETPSCLFALTSSFLELLIQLVKTCTADVFISSPCFPVVFDFVVNVVLKDYHVRNSLNHRAGEKFFIASLSIQFLTLLLSIFSRVYQERFKLSPENSIILERLSFIIHEVLGNQEFVRNVCTFPSNISLQLFSKLF